MSSYSTTASPPPATTGAKTGTSRWYAFTVLALAAFLLLLAICRQPQRRYVATAVLHRLGADRETRLLDGAAIHQLLTSDQMLETALQATAKPDTDGERQITPQLLSDGLTVRRQAANAPGVYLVSCTGDEPAWPTALVNQLCHQLLVQQGEIAADEPSVASKQADTAGQAAAARIAEAEVALGQARQQLAEFVEESVPDQAPVEVETAADAGGQVAEGPTDEVAETAANRQRLAALEQQRQQLLVAMTMQHPQVQSLTNEIERLQASLPVSRPPTADAAASPAAPTLENTEARQAEMLAEYQRLEQLVADAQRSLQDARLAAQSEQETLRAAPPTNTWHLTPATVALPVPDPIAAPKLLLAVVVGLTSGGGAMLVMAGKKIDSVSRAEKAFGAPVLSAWTESGPGVSPLRRGRGRLARRLVLSGELVLAVFLLAMILAAIFDHSFAHQFRSDPLAALIDGVHHLIHVAWS